MTLMRVDLPAPFSPSNAWISPARKSNETPLSARTAPKDLVTAVSRRRGRITASFDGFWTCINIDAGRFQGQNGSFWHPFGVRAAYAFVSGGLSESTPG